MIFYYIEYYTILDKILNIQLNAEYYQLYYSIIIL